MSTLPRVITKKELRLIVPFSPQHIWRLEKQGKFPKRIPIGARRVGWWLHDVLEWLALRSGKPVSVIAAEFSALGDLSDRQSDGDRRRIH
jgi:prophage regulatory protein